VRWLLNFLAGVTHWVYAITTNASNISSNDTDIATNVTNIATNVTNISTNASNLVLTGAIVDDVSGNLITTGQYLTDEINTVSGLIPSTVVDGAGVANYTARWSDGNTLTTGALVDNGTNVGIGVAAPQATLHVNVGPTDSEDAGVLMLSTYDSTITTTTGLGRIEFAGTENNSTWDIGGRIAVEASEDWAVGSAAGANMYFQLNTTGGTALATKMTILNDGNVGIGESAPSSQLSIGGNSTTTLKPTVAIVDMTAGAMLQLRGQAPTIFMDSTSSGIPTILTDGRGIEIKDGTLDAQGTVDFVIDANGDVGIGTDNPAYRCDVYDTVANIAIFRSTITSYARVIIRSGATGDAQLCFQNNTSSKWTIGNDGGDSDKFKIATGGGAFVASEALIVDTSGNLSILGTLTEASSLAIKENIETYSPSLEMISKIRPVRFNKKKSGKKEVGLVAEELVEMFPELVEMDEKGNPAGVNYSRAVAVLLHGFKELYKEVKELKEKI